MTIPARVCAILGVLACLTVRQLPMWSSDVALWSVAAAVNTTSPRPAYNLGLALRKAGRFPEAVTWLMIAGERAAGQPRQIDVERAIRLQLEAMEMSGFYVCDSPALQRYCSSS